MESRKELDLNQLPSDNEQPFQAFRTLTNYYVQALEAGPSNPTKGTGAARALQTKTSTILHNKKISRGSTSRDLEYKFKSPVKIGSNPPAMPFSYAQPFSQVQKVNAQPLQQQKLGACPFQMQQLYTQPLRQQNVASQPLRPQPLYAQPFQMEQLYARLLQEQQIHAQPLKQQKFYAQQFQLQQHYAQLLQEQQLYGQPFQPQKLDAQPLQQQHFHAQPFQPQHLYQLQQFYALLRQQQRQQHPSSSAANAAPVGNVENIKPIGNIEHPLPEGTISIPGRLYCPYFHVKSARLENQNVFEFSKNKNKPKEISKKDGDCSCTKCQDSVNHTGECSGGEYFKPLTLKTLKEIRTRVRKKIK